MKNIIMALCLLLLFGSFGYSQTIAAPGAESIKADSLAIVIAANNYVEGFYNGDAKRVSTAVHPELVKRIIYKDTQGNTMIQNMGASALAFAAVKYKKADASPAVAFKATVSVFDIFKETATIKIVTNKFNFIDYAQLAKIDGQWKIINVLWAMD